MPSARRYKTGRPTKRTKAVLKVLFDAIKEGVPYKLACMAAGITYDCFQNWRQKDPAFNRQVEELVAKPAIDLFKIIRQQAPETWQAGAWTLERRFPEMFAKPEAQLNIVAQAAVVNGQGTPHNVQMVVVSDLEFVGLKRHPAYTHRPGVREAEQVPPELDGTLERANQNIIVSSESAAKVRAERYGKIRARTEALLKAREANAGNGQTIEPEASSAGSEPVVAQEPATSSSDGAPAQEPLPAKRSAWWRPLIFGGTLISKADASEALRLILSELQITVDERALSFTTPNIVQATFCGTLEKLTGSDLGWRRLCEIYQRELQREEHRR